MSSSAVSGFTVCGSGSRQCAKEVKLIHSWLWCKSVFQRLLSELKPQHHQALTRTSLAICSFVRLTNLLSFTGGNRSYYIIKYCTLIKKIYKPITPDRNALIILYLCIIVIMQGNNIATGKNTKECRHRCSLYLLIWSPQQWSISSCKLSIFFFNNLLQRFSQRRWTAALKRGGTWIVKEAKVHTNKCNSSKSNKKQEQDTFKWELPSKTTAAGAVLCYARLC